MPAVGDQHKPNGATTNPFEDVKPRCSEYTAKEIATLQHRLDKQLGPEYISSRPGAAGQKVHYLAAEKVINLANEIFGFNGWSSSIQNIQIDFVDENAQTGKISLGLSVIVRVTLKDGTYHEDVGYGHIENCKGKAPAFEKAKKEGTTDALKRALRTFGNVLGNCVYDKDYVQKVTKVKVGASRWDVENLHRHPDYAPKKEDPVKLIAPAPISTESSTTGMMDSFDMADFDDAEFDDSEFCHPDEIVLPADPGEGWQGQKMGNRGNGIGTTPQVNKTGPSVTPSLRPQGQGARADVRTNGSNATGSNTYTTAAPNVMPRPPPGQGTGLVPGQTNNQTSSPGAPSEHFQVQQPNLGTVSNPKPTNRTAGFYSARAASNIDADNPIAVKDPSKLPVFNPHAESPSIRKTAGIDHSKSLKLKRDHVSEFLSPEARAELERRQALPAPPGPPGVPAQALPGMGARSMNGSAFRPVTRRAPESQHNTNGSVTVPGGVDRVLAAVNRTPLGDVSNIQHSVTSLTADGAEAKRQKIGGPDVVIEDNATRG